jgi:uncharacterized membrane protein
MGMKLAQIPSKIPEIAKGNIQAITSIERNFLGQRSRVDRLSDTISSLAGRISFVIAHIVLFAGWILANSRAVSGLVPFDPYPFGLLALIVALEVFFLSTFVLMSQNRQSHQSDHWAHLSLQIGLLVEQESAKQLKLLKAVCSHLGLETEVQDTELSEMVGKKSVGELAEKLAEKLEETRDLQQPLPGGR